MITFFRALVYMYIASMVITFCRPLVLSSYNSYNFWRLRFLGFNKEEAEAVAAILSETPMDNNPIGPEGVEKLAKILPRTKITQLYLSSHNIGDGGLKALAKILPRTKITELYLSSNNIGDEGLKALAEVLPRTKITRLYLFRNNIGDEGLEALAEVLPRTKITRLNLYENLITLEGVKDLAKIVPEEVKDLAKIVPEGVKDLAKIVPEEVKDLAKILPKTKITELDLSKNKIGDEGAKALAKILPHTQIRGLDLSKNNIGDEGVKDLVKILPKTKIISLNLEGTRIGADAEKELVKGLKINPSIISVKFLYNNDQARTIDPYRRRNLFLQASLNAEHPVFRPSVFRPYQAEGKASYIQAYVDLLVHQNDTKRMTHTTLALLFHREPLSKEIIQAFAETKGCVKSLQFLALRELQKQPAFMDFLATYKQPHNASIWHLAQAYSDHASAAPLSFLERIGLQRSTQAYGK